jgi:hypothetical protein
VWGSPTTSFRGGRALFSKAVARSVRTPWWRCFASGGGSPGERQVSTSRCEVPSHYGGGLAVHAAGTRLVAVAPFHRFGLPGVKSRRRSRMRLRSGQNALSQRSPLSIALRGRSRISNGRIKRRFCRSARGDRPGRQSNYAASGGTGGAGCQLQAVRPRRPVLSPSSTLGLRMLCREASSRRRT